MKMASFPNMKGREGKEDNFIFEGKQAFVDGKPNQQGYYGRYCVNYLKKCEDCKWYETLRCRDGQLKG